MARRLATLYALGGLGCAGSSGAPRATTAPAPEVAHCRVEGTADELLVAVSGVTVPAVRASGVPAELDIELVGGAPSAAAHVLGPIDFVGRTPLETAHLIAEVPVVRGPLTVYPGAPLLRASVGPSGLRALLLLSGDPSAPALSVYLELSCAELALGAEGTPPPDIVDPTLPTHVLVGTQDLSVALAPGGPTALTFAIGESEGAPLQLELVEEREGWAHVRSRLYWAELDGWVPSARIRAEAQDGWRLDAAFGYGGLGACGRSDHPYSYRGPATVRARATVHDEASRVVWGRFARDTEVEIGVRADGGNGFAEVLRVEGIDTPECSSLEFDHAMVPLEAVVLP